MIIYSTDEDTEIWRKKLVQDQRPRSGRTGIQSQCLAMVFSSVSLMNFSCISAGSLSDSGRGIFPDFKPLFGD